MYDHFRALLSAMYEQDVGPTTTENRNSRKILAHAANYSFKTQESQPMKQFTAIIRQTAGPAVRVSLHAADFPAAHEKLTAFCQGYEAACSCALVVEGLNSASRVRDAIGLDESQVIGEALQKGMK